MISTFSGSPAEIGAAYGAHFKDRVLYNIDYLLASHIDRLRANPAFIEWRDRYDARIAAEMPWYAEEMRAVAQAVGVEYDVILMLNLRAWQYELYSGIAEEHCSSAIIRLADGTDVNMGALDDPYELYCGPVRIVPDEGYAFISFPITGTGWGNRGMNEAGLTCGISSQILPGLKGLPDMFNQDIAMRAILQTCATVDEVRAYCAAHPFTLNIAVSDAKGGRLCIHNTIAGPLELRPDEPAVMTNHVTSDERYKFFVDRGVRSFPESPTTRMRRSNLINYIAANEGRVSFDEARAWLATQTPDDTGTILNTRTVALTAGNPMAQPNSLWVMYPSISREFVRYDIRV